jgi:hypothetical protein
VGVATFVPNRAAWTRARFARLSSRTVAARGGAREENCHALPGARGRLVTGGRADYRRAPAAALSISSFAPAWIHGKSTLNTTRTPRRV